MNAYSRDLHFDIILPRLKVMTYKQVLMEFSKQAGKALNVSDKRLFKLLMEKEHQSSSGAGDNIAIPDLQVAGPQSHLTIIASLEHPVDCNAADNEPVDLVCLVLSPENEGPYHLRRLSRISRLLKHDALHKKLAEARDEQAMRALLIDPEGWLMAA